MDVKEARMNARKRIGISIASLFHIGWLFCPKMWTRWAVKTAREAGYAFLQALPCRGSEVLMPGGSLPIKYLEPAWRGVDGEGHGSFWQVLHRHKDPTGPRIEDWLFFPKATGCKEGWKHLLLMGAGYHVEGLIFHSPEEIENAMGELLEVTQAMMATLEYLRQQRGEEKIPRDKVELAAGPAATPRLIEVSPGLWKTAEEIRDGGACRYSDGLVLDTWHLRRLPRVDEIFGDTYYRVAHLEDDDTDPRGYKGVPDANQSCLGWWKESLPKLLPQTRVIHVQPRRDDKGEELRKFIRSEPTELGQMIARARLHGYEGDYVVEASLGPFGTPGKIREMITGMHGAVLDHLTAPLGQLED